MQICMWICGTGNKKLRSPTPADKAHGKGRGQGTNFWTDIIHAAIGDGLLSLNFSVIRANGLFRDQIAATLTITEEGVKAKEENVEWNLPIPYQEEKQTPPKKKRAQGGSNLMPIIEELLSSSDNWYEVESTKHYQYPGVFQEPTSSEEVEADPNPPRMGHVVNLHTLPHFSGQNHHLLYNENQLSRGHYNDNVCDVDIDGQKQQVHIRYAACKGVLKCSMVGCTFTGSQTTKKCPNHPEAEMKPSGSCPVYIVYVYPKDYTENSERWVTGITKDRLLNKTSNNLHNHPLPQPSKVPTLVKESVTQAVRSNPTLTPSQLNLGKYYNCLAIICVIMLCYNINNYSFTGIGVGFMPMAVSSAAHSDRVKKIYRMAVKEITAAAGPSGASIIDKLDSAYDVLDKNDEDLSDGGTILYYYSMPLAIKVSKLQSV